MQDLQVNPEHPQEQNQLFQVEASQHTDFGVPASLSIVGISTSGQAAARLAVTVGCSSILISDSNPQASLKDESLAGLKDQVQLEIGANEELLHHAEVVVLSPGIPPHADLLKSLQAKGFTLLSEPDWACLNQPKHARDWISITGTNGKSTITSLIAHLLNGVHPQVQSVACGNIGKAVSDVVTESLMHETPLQIVAELSSYQLYYSTHLKQKIGVFSNLTPDHLNWHGDWQAYVDAKARLFIGDYASEYAVLNLDDPIAMQWQHQRNPAKTLGVHTRPHALEALVVPQLFVNEDGVLELYIPTDFQADLAPLLAFNEIQLKRTAYSEAGGHHTQNMLLAIGAVLWDAFIENSLPKLCEKTSLEQRLSSFQGLAHRFQRLAVPAPFVVINDSKATNPEAGMSALRCVDPTTPAILLVGGLSKKTPLQDWAKLTQEKTSAVFCFGKDAHDFYEALENIGYDKPFSIVANLQDATRQALTLQQTHPNYPVLLAPACASQDAFTGFEERGRVFESIVHAFFKELA
ncbi:MAG: UDP-N-acetylmuramoyl-L-alanine--D-glutamate ligase [Vampirovibrionales bacterium]|jgi:UDP-N-acetylmuramoylalanine--D-glutamate ligase|nr:UDP-N-acetylmuramoyl-L-alanine--D-glutamate ligase [Vampirovibrionales bacterium]